MVHAPPLGYAGRIGDEVIVTDRTDRAVYVRFDSGIAECYPPLRFAELFCSRRTAGSATAGRHSSATR